MEDQNYIFVNFVIKDFPKSPPFQDT
ncbi:unnamed protein product [Larinioides sclopetarius]|uniref:Uncharacterized protein n=1 Tax=Larinioides sclopetarius TaxID=280406 RepID=A0AAV2AY48_9ARAC